MPQVIDIDEILAPPGACYAVAWLDEPLVAYGKLVLVGLWPITTLDANSPYMDDFAGMGDRPYIGLNLTLAKATLEDIFAEEVSIPSPEAPKWENGPYEPSGDGADSGSCHPEKGPVS